MGGYFFISRIFFRIHISLSFKRFKAKALETFGVFKMIFASLDI